MGFSSLAAWDEDLKVLLQDAPVAGARLLQRLLRPVNLALVVVVIDVELPGRGGVLFGWMNVETSSLLTFMLAFGMAHISIVVLPPLVYSYWYWHWYW